MPIDKPIRVTVSSIGKRIGALMLLQKKLDKLPLTKVCLQEFCETPDAFRIRKVQYAAERLKQKHESLMVWRIVREARLRPNYSDAVAAEIARHVSGETTTASMLQES